MVIEITNDLTKHLSFRVVNQRLDHIEKAVSLGPKKYKKLMGDTKREVMAMKMEREKQVR